MSVRPGSFADMEYAALATHEIVMRSAKREFERSGTLYPAAFVLTTVPSENVVSMHPESFENPRDKDAFAAQIREIARLTKSVGVIFAAEAWVTTAAPGTLEGLDSAHPEVWVERIRSAGKRIECLMVHLDHRSGYRAWRSEIHREAGVVRLDDWIEVRGVSSRVGRLANLSFQWD